MVPSICIITCSCYRRQPQLHTAGRRDLFLTILEEARCKYRFVVHGYVLMPEHFHLLITDPEMCDPSVVMKVVKERFTRQLNQRRKTPSAQPPARGFYSRADLAKAFLRFQRVER
jgi:REP element-mobilizing transposase RayT